MTTDTFIYTRDVALPPARMWPLLTTADMRAIGVHRTRARHWTPSHPTCAWVALTTNAAAPLMPLNLNRTHAGITCQNQKPPFTPK